MATGAPELTDWIGRTERREDTIAPAMADAMSATLDRSDPPARPGDPLPPVWHWMLFWDICPLSDLGRDGHPKRGRFLPPVPLPRRMWAGSRLEFAAPLRIGDRVRRVSTIETVETKQGRSGQLVFVTVRHEIEGSGGGRVVDRHDIVYRDDPDPDAPPPGIPPIPALPVVYQRSLVPDPVMLFRYSALTFNGHRIHYDAPYARQVEGYQGLVVHGPLLATLLLDLMRRWRPDREVRRFAFRALRPVTAGSPLHLSGALDAADTARLWTHLDDGGATMTATVELAP